MIVDSSAILAILKDEQDAGRFRSALEAADSVTLGAPTLLETSVVAGPDRHDDVDQFLTDSLAVVLDFSHQHAAAARAAYARYGKNSGSRAKLNFGDCMSYALAKVREEPLLFKGEDFGHTDITPALPPEPPG